MKRPRQIGIEIMGQKYGLLTVTALADRDEHGKTQVECLCECGKTGVFKTNAIRSGHTKSCGCNYRKHGHSVGHTKTKEYTAWACMHDRCRNPRAREFKYYGARGIKVCEEWGTFKKFFEDMGFSPPGTSIERIDNNKGYSKENCKWATKKEQMANRRNTIWIEIGGVKKPLDVWAQEKGFKDGVVYSRYRRGWPISKLYEPETRPVVITIGGRSKRVSEWAKESGVSRKTIERRMKAGLTGEQLLTPIT